MTISEFLRLGLAIIFAFAGIAKLAGPASFRATMRSFLRRERSVRAASWLVPALEIAAAALLLWPVRWFGEGLTVLLASGFAAVAGIALARKERIECHCFGKAIPQTLGVPTLLLAGMLALSSAYLLYDGSGRSPLKASPADAGAAILIWVGLFAIVALLRAMFRSMRSESHP
ncbi:hypothetical protein H7B90_28735 [Cohnella xylanilytica]|uniref:Methylamine utilisation protein MauE domain-containing protein n=1 Tax=Cohnella xylanilytica TaxID=557555 RepID=A0A841U8Q1_9BACL|nr:MauE/DoxX family redox-associated membrane protein [Cohnella xylanilytica]MBB6695388.1 hypothetical protein [Cohnella xylanilytica]